MKKKQIKESENKIVKSVNKNVRSSTRKLNPILKALVGNQENNISDKNKELNNIIKINKKLANTIKSLSIKHKKLESNLFQYDKANNALSFKINQQKIDLQENKINLSKIQVLEDELNHYQKVLPFFLKEFSRLQGHCRFLPEPPRRIRHCAHTLYL